MHARSKRRIQEMTRSLASRQTTAPVPRAAARSPLRGPNRRPAGLLLLPFLGGRAGTRRQGADHQALELEVSPGVSVPGHLCVEQPCGVYLRPAICMTKPLLVDASVAWRC